MRRRRTLGDNDPAFYTCPQCRCRDLTVPDRGTHDLQGRKLYQCTACGRITSDELLKRASRQRRRLD
jgi:hypothetical protein